MQEKELRLAVVLTGGVSLAIYMHGVSKELLKLVRASRSYHKRTGGDGGGAGGYADSCGGREVDTEKIYFDLLKSFAPQLDLRVVIDVVAGVSAGGVNGVMLARALAHDLDTDHHRLMWLQNADVTHLLDEPSFGAWWRKLYVWPVAGLLGRRLRGMAPEAETREKLSSFLRSRWFQPPFSGPRYSSWLLDATIDMDRNAPPGGTLLPDGHPLDLFVSVTDFFGHINRIPLHDPADVEERDHRHVLHFHYNKLQDGTVQSDFDADALPGLVFAARATSCFPGAFPPASLGEIDQVLEERGETWPGRDRFVEQKFAGFTARGQDVESLRFIDGSVINNKPFAEAVAAIAGRPAHREVTRRIVFVEPNPIHHAAADDVGEPGFFRTILASLAEIPRNEPIHDDLARVNSFNKNIRLVSQVVRQARPLVTHLVEKILPPHSEQMQPSTAEVTAWRQTANEKAAAEAGYAFQSYFRLKVLRVARRLETLITGMAWPGGSADMPVHARLGFLAALGEHGVFEIDHSERPGAVTGSDAEINFLKLFDVDYRVRRLRFVIRRLNELYRVAEETPGIKPHTEKLDELKATLYGLLEDAKQRWEPPFYEGQVIAGLGNCQNDAEVEPGIFGSVLSALGEAMTLHKLDETIDEVFAVMVLNYFPEELRRDLFAAYIGFSFFDVMSYPMVQWEDLDEFEEILIDRISPDDADAIRQGGTPDILRGTSLRRFGGFFNKSYRENDYLWGRLNAADRLVDIIVTAVSESGIMHDIDVVSIKHRLFTAILDAEEPFLVADPDLISTIRAEIAH